MNNLESAKQRYLNDPEFHRVVQTIEAWIEQMHVTPSEARDAAMLAAINVEMRTNRPRFSRPEEPEQ